MEVQIVDTTEDFLKLKDTWDDLYKQDDKSSIYSSFDFKYNWWLSYQDKDDYSLFIMTVEHNNRIVAIAPFFLEDRSYGPLKWKELKFMGLGDFNEILVEYKEDTQEASFKAIFDYIYEEKVCDRVLLSYIANYTDLSYYLLKSDIFNKDFKVLGENVILDTSDFESQEDFDKHAPRKHRKDRNKMRRELGASMSLTRNIDEDLFREISDLHREEQEYLIEDQDRSDRRSLFNDERKNAYLERNAQIDEINLIFTLRSESGELLAYRGAYDDGKRIYFWNSAYNYKYKSYSPSSVSLYEAISYLIENLPGRIVDFGAGRYAWKFRWSRDFILTYQLEYWLEGRNNSLIKRLMEIKELL